MKVNLGLSFPDRKYSPTRYKINGVQLKEVDHHPYLGVELTTDLNCKTPISILTSNVNKILNLLSRYLIWLGPRSQIQILLITRPTRPRVHCTPRQFRDPYFKQVVSAIEKKVQRKGARFVGGDYSYRNSVT